MSHNSSRSGGVSFLTTNQLDKIRNRQCNREVKAEAAARNKAHLAAGHEALAAGLLWPPDPSRQDTPSTTDLPISNGLGPWVPKKGPVEDWADVATKLRKSGHVPDTTWVNIPPKPKTEAEVLKEKIDMKLDGWPWKDCPAKLITVAPFLPNFYHSCTINAPFKLEKATQTTPFWTKLMANNDLARIMVDLLFQNHSTAWKFGATCRVATFLIGNYINHWDMTGTIHGGGWFNNCERPRFGPDAPTDPDNQGSVASVVVVSPFRRMEGGPPSYYEQTRNLFTSMISFRTFKEFFQNIQFHRVGFLSAHHLALIIPHMRNLKVLGIYQCPLLPISETLRLLKIIQTDRPLKNQVSLDFYPMYHQGPKLRNGDAFRVGDYGVTWDNWDHDTIKAVWALCYRILPQARKQDVDFESPHTGFRQYMDRGPCHKVPEIIDAIFDEKMTTESFAALIDCHNPEHMGRVELFTDNKFIGCRPEGYGTYTLTYLCSRCRVYMPGIFFKYQDIFNWKTFQASLQCLGCKLIQHLRSERDHYKGRKRHIIHKWLHNGGDGGWNDTDIDRAILDYEANDIAASAIRLDNRRMRDMTCGDRIDKEYDEVQEKIDLNSLGKLGYRRQSPMVHEKNIVWSKWNWFPAERARAHGM
ncbi:unnamed protein product [Diplocarpon coronariae]|uniref:Uncharacterized protein n=1 Tax=Diplocarpon coronariae TaxID=2795749 RepID=A0A218Z9I8_9HELO|nr:hypothetical protein B2J93_4023 [Marssonina coronariae]